MRAMNRRHFVGKAAGGASAGILGLPLVHGAAQEVGEREVTITLWSWYNRAFRELIPLFNEQYPNITVELVDVAGADMRQRAVTALIGGSGAPDIVGGQDYDVPVLAATGGLVDLTEYLAPHQDRIVPYKLRNATYEDKLYSVPWDAAPSALYYRQDILEQHGIDASEIETYDNLLDIGKQLGDATDGEVRLFNLARQSSEPLINLAWQQGGGIYDIDSGDVIIDDERAVRALTWLKQLWDAGVVHQDVGKEADQVTVADGTSVIIPHAIWYAGLIESFAPDTIGKWRIVPLPKFSAEDARTFARGGSQLMITNQSQAIPEAFAFLEFTQLTQQGATVNWEAGALFPVLQEASDWPIMNEDVEFYGGQKALRLYADLNSEVPPYRIERTFVEARDIISNAVTAVLDGDTDPQSALSDAADQIRDAEFF